MAVHLRQAGTDGLSKLLKECATDDLTYEPIGGSLTSVVPPDLHRHHWQTRLPATNAFERATDALQSWGMHRGAGLLVIADGPIAVGTDVAMSAPLPFGHVDVTCRIVAVIDESDRYGFAYGTLRVHPERGEEAFVVTREGSSARFDVDAISRPADPVSRLLPFVADRQEECAPGVPERRTGAFVVEAQEWRSDVNRRIGCPAVARSALAERQRIRL